MSKESDPRLRHDYGTVDLDYTGRMARWDAAADGPIYMVNLMKYREVATYDSADAPAISGREADDRYNPVAVLAKIGADIVFVADVADDLVGDEDWDRIAIVRYPTRRSFIDMQRRDDFADKHVHKAAGMSRTTLLGTRPLDASIDGRGRPRPSPAGAGWVLMVVRRTDDRDGAFAELPGATHLAVEGLVVGDGRRFDTVSLLACTDAADARGHAARLALQPGSSYAMVLRANLDGLTA